MVRFFVQEHEMKKYKLILRGFFMWIGVLGSLWLFLIATSLIPNELIKNKLLKSAALIASTDSFSYHEGSKMNGIADNYADSIWLNVAFYMGKEEPVLASVDTKYYDGEKVGEKKGLYFAITEDNREANTDYTRYWHGTVGMIRLLHLVTDVNGIRAIGFLVTLCLAAVIMFLLISDGKDMLAISFFLSLCMVKVWNIRLCMEYQPAFIFGFFICILYMIFEKKGDDNLYLCSIAGGTGIAFFDFLTIETIVILLPLILVLTIRGMEKRMGSFYESIRFVIWQGVTWLGAYGMTFLAKWSIASVMTQNNKFDLAVNLAGVRISGMNSGTEKMGVVLQKLAALAANLSVLCGGGKRLSNTHITMGIGFMLLYVIIVILCLRFGKEESRDTTKILALLGSLIVLRYLALNNHSYTHAFFTYRGMLSMIMALFSIITINIQIIA